VPKTRSPLLKLQCDRGGKVAKPAGTPLVLYFLDASFHGKFAYARGRRPFRRPESYATNHVKGLAVKLLIFWTINFARVKTTPGARRVRCSRQIRSLVVYNLRDWKRNPISCAWRATNASFSPYNGRINNTIVKKKRYHYRSCMFSTILSNLSDINALWELWKWEEFY